MTEDVIREVGIHQWPVFADRKCSACCADEKAASQEMSEHSARNHRLLSSDVAPGQRVEFDDWIAKQPQLSPSRPEAMRRLVEIGLKVKGK